jgi:arginyl-tRNA synthetase
VGDTLARLLKTCGHDLQTEYYVNDAGNQMKILGRSLWVRYRQLMGEAVDLPENHYQGDYMKELAAELKETSQGTELLDLPEDKAVETAAKYACDRILEGIKEDLSYFGVSYDNYFRERSLYESGAIPATLDELRNRGKTEQHEGALWFTMNDQQDEKDRVLVRATGEPTYFAADAAYHENKLKRGFGLLVDIWGADHHGYVPRVRAAIEALGHDPNALKVLLVQFVTLVREGKKISMSTRSGEFVTLREVLDEVGPDAARFFFLTKRCDSHLDFDLDLAKKQSRDNPVYYVQYAHARVASIFRIAAERDIDVDTSNPDLEALSLPEEQRLVKHLGDFPDMLSEAAESLEPHRITFYLMELAETFHAYYHDNRVLIEDQRLKKARLYLVEAVRQVIANGLGILGVSAPERM